MSLVGRYNLVRVYCDPPKWTTEIDDWALKYGEKTFLRIGRRTGRGRCTRRWSGLS
jgi:hypothetical protein